MRKLFVIFILLILSNPVNAFSFNSQEKAVKNVILSQFKYANKCNFDKFISTFDKDYVNADGFNLDIYSELVKDIWSTYENIRYNVKIKDVAINGDSATINVTEYTNADLPLTKNYTGRLDSVSESTYYLKKNDGKWKIVSDSVSDETTTMLYGQAKNLNIKLSVPTTISPDTEYTASLEFIPPQNMLAVASIAADKVEYPQPKTKEVFRAMPNDNILERLFTSNNDNVNEYVIASIGLTQTDIKDLSIKMSLTGFGYVIKRVNVVPVKEEEEKKNDQN
jgi:hypothetical protein